MLKGAFPIPAASPAMNTPQTKAKKTGKARQCQPVLALGGAGTCRWRRGIPEGRYRRR